MTKYNLYDKLNFGKYEGKIVKDVLNSDLSYISWCLQAIENFGLGRKAKALYNQLIKEEDWCMDYGYWADWDW